MSSESITIAQYFVVAGISLDEMFIFGWCYDD